MNDKSKGSTDVIKGSKLPPKHLALPFSDSFLDTRWWLRWSLMLSLQLVFLRKKEKTPFQRVIAKVPWRGQMRSEAYPQSKNWVPEKLGTPLRRIWYDYPLAGREKFSPWVPRGIVFLKGVRFHKTGVDFMLFLKWKEECTVTMCTFNLSNERWLQV